LAVFTCEQEAQLFAKSGHMLSAALYLYCLLSTLIYDDTSTKTDLGLRELHISVPDSRRSDDNKNKFFNNAFFAYFAFSLKRTRHLVISKLEKQKFF
jgi:hypothetical protein